MNRRAPATQPSPACPACGRQNPAHAIYCAACGTPLAGEGADVLANEVAGAPVAQEQRSATDALAGARARMQEVLPEVTATVVESVNRLATMSRDPRRVAHWQRRTEEWRRWVLTRTNVQPPAPPPPAVPVPIAARVVWFVLIGSWLTCLWVVATWLTMLTVVGMPLARRMLDLAPTVLTLRPTREAVDRWRRQAAYRAAIRKPQHEFAVRALYFAFVGWWASLIWLLIAYCLSLTAIGIPVGYTMFDRTPAVAYLERQ